MFSWTAAHYPGEFRDKWSVKLIGRNPFYTDKYTLSILNQ